MNLARKSSSGIDLRPIAVITVLVSMSLAGCVGSRDTRSVADLVWGRSGLSDGRFRKPRALAIDAQDRLYVVDMTGRIQVFNRDGEFVRSWKTPTIERGKPCGLTIDGDGNLMVADTHYYRLLFYSTTGALLDDRTIGGTFGSGPGEFGFVTDAVQDSHGNYYICEYGDYDRVQKFSRDGQFLMQWGAHGSEPGDFIQPRGLAVDGNDHIWVADACNHRIQVFDATGDSAKLVRIWGEQGSAPGQLSYPYGVTLHPLGTVYVSEFGNSRIQKFSLEGEFLASWGTPGREDGQLNQPWDLVCDSQGFIHVLDSYNHRVQRIRF
jgi:sugar lactone lactonase YvrE